MADEPSPHQRRQSAPRRRALALQMRREGGSYDAIASRLGTNRQSAQRIVSRQLKNLAREDDPELTRQLHVEALRELWRSLVGPASRGDLDAIDRFLKVEERIAQLTGIDAPLVAADGEPSQDGAPTSRTSKRDKAAGDDNGAEPASKRRRSPASEERFPASEERFPASSQKPRVPEVSGTLG